MKYGTAVEKKESVCLACVWLGQFIISFISINLRLIAAKVIFRAKKGLSHTRKVKHRQRVT